MLIVWFFVYKKLAQFAVRSSPALACGFFATRATWEVCEILFPDQGLNPCPLQWKQSLNHWTASEVL